MKVHNKKIETLHNNTHPNKQCNCKDKESCPLQGNCQQKKKKNAVYRVTVKTNYSVKQYIGATEGTLKQLSFSKSYLTNTSLSTHIWHLKDMNVKPTITREIQKFAPAYSKKKKKKMPPLSSWETRNYHSSVTKHTTKQKIRNIIEMLTWEQTSTFAFRSIHMAYLRHHYPPYQHHLHH